jgi:hypothetical protein
MPGYGHSKKLKKPKMAHGDKPKMGHKPKMAHGKPMEVGPIKVARAIAKKEGYDLVKKASMYHTRAKMAMPKKNSPSNFPALAEEMAKAMDYNSSKPMMTADEDEKAASRQRGKKAAMKAQAKKDKAAGTHTGTTVKVRRSDGSVIEVDSRGQIAKVAAKSGNIIK